MATPAGMAQSPNQRPTQQNQGRPDSNDGGNEDGVSVRPMRLKVLYTFDDQNKTNCLARGEDVLQVQTVALDETTSIGILDLKTCIETVTRCSPELISRVGQDYTVYAYDYSEYDNPLVGQGMLSRVLASASPQIAPAQQSQKLITGRVCKNILGLFNNGVKETLEVKLRLVPVPTAMQGEYVNTMERYREMSGSIPAGFDHSEWTKFLQSNPNMTQMANTFGAPPSNASSHRGSMNMEVVNQLLSPNLPQQQAPAQDPFNQPSNAESGNESRGDTNTSKGKKTSRPSSRASVKRPRAKRQPKAVAATGGNTSGYEEGTDGDEAPVPRKRAKITQTDWKKKSSFGAPTDSLRVAASTAGSLRRFRPIAMSPAPVAGSHLQEVPRAPTPVPILPKQQLARDQEPSQSGLRQEAFGIQIAPFKKHISPYPTLVPIEDQIRDSIESANPSPERRYSPAETPPEIGSSPPVMRNVSIRSSPPCPSSPVLPEMPRTDSGFMSGTLDELFGEDDDEEFDDDYIDTMPYIERRRKAREEKLTGGPPREFVIQEVIPGPMELLPTTMPVFTRPPPKSVSKSVQSRANSVMSEDGQSLPPPKAGPQASSRQPSPVCIDLELPTAQPEISQVSGPDNSQANSTTVSTPATQPAPPTNSTNPPTTTSTQPQRGSRMLVRTASMGSLSLPAIPASDPVLPPSSLQRSQTWAEAPHSATEGPPPMPFPMQQMAHMSYMPHMFQMPVPQLDARGMPISRTIAAKKASIRQKLEEAIAKGEMPPFCGNCGTIETATWRKAWSQEHQGAPGYFEYSDEPGRVTAINVLARDAEGNPTLYQLIKKRLGDTENQLEWKQFTLCNPCGIWMSKYKSHRPEANWECNTGRTEIRRRSTSKPPATRRPARPRSKKNQSTAEAYYTSDANIPQSDMYYPQSEAYYPQSEAIGPPDGVSPPGGPQQLDLQIQRVELPTDQPPRANRPPKRLNAMTSDAASAALRRAIQSSPARWVGTQQSPIDVEDVGSTRRLLFPSPRKDGSPKVLGELETNVVQIEAEGKSPKEQTAEAVNKENCPPVVDANDADAELLAMFQEEMARPATPVQNAPAPNPFKTPTRPTPSHRPVTRSISRSIRSAKSPGQLLMFAQHTPSKTPSSSARRRSPRNHYTVFESPFTASLNQLMSEANNPSSPSRHFNMDLDFGNLPDLPMMDNNMQHNQGDLDFNMNDFFSTDMPMPSSPPKMFHLYEDPAAMANIDWNEFSQYDDEQLLNDVSNQNNSAVQIKREPEEDNEGPGDQSEFTTAGPVQELQPNLVADTNKMPATQSNVLETQADAATSATGQTTESAAVEAPQAGGETPQVSTEESAEDDKEDEVDMVRMDD